MAFSGADRDGSLTRVGIRQSWRDRRGRRHIRDVPRHDGL